MLKLIRATLTLSFILFSSSLSFASAATDIQVIIDGKTYFCSNNGGGYPGVSNCAKVTQAANFKFNACKSAGNYASDCFKQTFPSRPQECNLSDTAWSTACDTNCKSAGNYASDCYKLCY